MSSIPQKFSNLSYFSKFSLEVKNKKDTRVKGTSKGIKKKSKIE